MANWYQGRGQPKCASKGGVGGAELVSEVEQDSPPHTALALEPNSWGKTELCHTLELSMESGVRRVWGY